MSTKILTTSSQIQCPHLGKLNLITKNTKIIVDGAATILETDVSQVFGCIFTTSAGPSPCKSVKWSCGTNRVTINGTPILIQTSIGTCYNSSQVPQGVATIISTQMKVSAQ